MEALRVAFARIRAVLFHDRLDRDFTDELKAHADLLIDEARQRGLTPEEARREALLKLGGMEPTRDLHRDTRGLPTLESILQDLRYTFRTMRRDAGFCAIAILILALGIGATTAIFSVVNALLIRPLPFRNPGRLVWIANNDGGGASLSSLTLRVGAVLELERMNHSFEGLAGYMAFFGYDSYKLIGQGEPERLSGVGVSQNFFHLLGVQPEIGRTFTNEECQWNGGRTTAALLTHGLWVRRFASDRNIVGRKIVLNDAPVTVVGVLPASFDFASVFTPAERVDLVLPFPFTPETDRWGNTLAVIGRLRPGVTVQQAQAEFDALGSRIRAIHASQWGTTWRTPMTGLREYISGRLRRPMLVLACAVALVMLIVCANLSNLLLARASSRRKEIAVRTALGAGRGRLVRQMLTESIVLSCCGAALGLVLAFGILRAASSVQTMAIPMLNSATINGSALLFTLAIALTTGILFGIAPAFQNSGPGLHEALKDSTRGSTEGGRRNWLRDVLVVTEIALACVLLVGAGLVMRSFLRVLDVDLGFRPERAMSLRIDIPSAYDNTAKKNSFEQDVLRRVREIRGVQAAGLTDSLPLDRNRSWGFDVKGRVFRPGEEPDAFIKIVSAGYLRAMGMSLRSGRDFNEHDTPNSRPVMIINETMARKIWPGQNPVGALVTPDREREVVGVIADVTQGSPDQKPDMEIYLPASQRDEDSYDLVVRTALPPAEIAPALRSALRPIDRTLPVAVRPLEALVDRAVSPRRFVTLLLGGFATLAVTLASLGIYGVISYSVSQRNQEIGIRIALGATASHVQLRVIRQTLILATIGIVIGIAGAWALSRLLSTLLFGVSATDPAIFAGMAAILGGVAVLAGYLPARRASRIDPMLTLRSA